MKTKLSAILILAIAALAGCGGATSSSTSSGFVPHAAVTIDSSNASTVTKTAIEAASQSLGKNIASPVGVQTSTSSTDRVLYNLSDLAAKIVQEQKNSTVSVTGVTPANPCFVSGDYTYTSNSATSSSITYNNCSNSAGSTLNGTYSLSGVTLTQVSNVLTSFAADVAFNLTMVTTGNPTIKLVGGYSFALSGLNTTQFNFRIQGSSFVVSVDNLNDSLTNFDFQSTLDTGTFSVSDTVKYTASSDFLNASYSFNTLSPIVKNSGDVYPSSGIFVISGAASNLLQVTILPTSNTNTAGTLTGLVKLELSTDGGITYPTTLTKTWADIAAGQ